MTPLVRAFRALLPALLLAACTDGGPFAAGAGSRRLELRPEFAGAGAAVTAPINRIRLVARDEASGTVLATHVQDVQPDAPAWELGIELPEDGVVVIVFVELLNVEGGVETVEWSGMVGPLRADAGASTSPAAVTLFPGPADNLTITSLELLPVRDILEGDTTRAIPMLQGGGIGSRVFFASLTPEHATVDDDGVIHGLLPGVARILATAGAVSDTLTLNILPLPNAITMDPDSIVLHSLGAIAEYHAHIIDSRGAEVTGAPISYWIDNPFVAIPVDGGNFRATGNGRTMVHAVGPGGLTAHAVLVVAQQIAAVEITPAVSTIDLGASATLVAEAKDANGNVVAASTFTWTSSNGAVATVSDAGVLTTHAPGTTTITATSGGISSSLVVTVVQTVERITISPDRVEFNAAGETQQLTASALDARGGNVAGTTFVWSSSDAGVATVDQAGVVRAVAPGTATIIATAGDRSATAEVIVHSADAALAGRVSHGATGESIAGVTVVLQQDGTVIATATSESHGIVRFTSLLPGEYTVDIVHEGFEPFTSQVVIEPGVETSAAFVLSPVFVEGNATLSGRVNSGFDGSNIANALIELFIDGVPIRSTATSATGEYSFTALPAGSYTAIISAPGYANNSSSFTLTPDQTLARNFALVPVAPEGQVRIVLTWNALPNDLDSHLMVPSYMTSGPTTVYYGNDGTLLSYPFASLDIDDTSGFGPETITISEQIPGTYVYGVHNYSGSPAMSTSGARVDVYRGNTQIATFNVPNQAGRYWTVFALNGTTLTPINTIGNSFTGPGGGVIGMPAIRADTEATRKK